MSTVSEVRPAGTDHLVRVLPGTTSVSSGSVRVHRDLGSRFDLAMGRATVSPCPSSVSAASGMMFESDALAHTGATDPDTASAPFRRILRTLDDPRYALAVPILVWVALDEAGYIVYDEENLTYGLAVTIESAMTEYKRSLIVDLELLQKDRDALAEPLLRRLSSLENHIRAQGNTHELHPS